MESLLLMVDECIYARSKSKQVSLVNVRVLANILGCAVRANKHPSSLPTHAHPQPETTTADAPEETTTSESQPRERPAAQASNHVT